MGNKVTINYVFALCRVKKV